MSRITRQSTPDTQAIRTGSLQADRLDAQLTGDRCLASTPRVRRWPDPKIDDFVGCVGIAMPWSRFDLQEHSITPDTYRAILEGVPAMLWLGDERGKCLFLNRAQREFWGVSIEGIASFDWSQTLHPDDICDLEKSFGTAMAKQEGFEVEARYLRADGAYRILNTTARPRFGPSGEFLGMTGVNVDVTDQRRSEQRVAMLTDELSHRMKNLFSVVKALVSTTQREVPEASAAFANLQGRLHALFVAYEETRDLAGVPCPKSLGDLAELVLAPFQLGDRIRCHGLDIRLPQRATAALALILNELATNSAKHGSLSGKGSLDLSAEQDSPDSFTITWRENGVGQSDPGERPIGFGSKLLDFTARDIGATLSRDWVDETFVIRITIPNSVLGDPS